MANPQTPSTSYSVSEGSQRPTDKDPAKQSDIRDWTVMVYMAAGDSHALDTVAVRDLREMERGANKNAHVVAQINRHWPGSAQRYQVFPREDDRRPGRSLLSGRQPTDETNMGKVETLKQFLKWGVTHFPARRYFLILWGHAYGLGFGRDHNVGLTLKDLQAALTEFKTNREKELWEEFPETKSSGKDGRLDLLGANACAMSYIEAAYELRECAEYMVASQITVPFAGWPYESILPRIDKKTSTKELGKLVVDTYVTQFNDLPGADRLAMTLLDLKGARPARDLVHKLAVAIEDEINGKGFDGDKLAFFRDVFIGASAGDVRPLIDLTDLCNDLRGDEDDPHPGAASKAAKDLQDLLAMPGRLIVHHKSHPGLEDLRGVGIYAPFVTNKETRKRLELQNNDEDDENGAKGRKLQTGEDAYKNLDLFRAGVDGHATEGMWPSLVYEVLRREIPADLMESIDGIGMMQRGDRADVAQIIMSIDSSLNRLDRVITKAAEDIVKRVRTNDGSPIAPSAVRQVASGKKSFGLPWLELAQPLSLEARVAALRQEKEFKALSKGNGNGSHGKPQKVHPGVITAVVTQFSRVERAIAEVERTTRRGLTHARFGLGPSSPNQVSLGTDRPKNGFGIDETTKPGEGIDETTKPGEGASSNGSSLTSHAPFGDLRADLALARVGDLFRQVAESLQQLERATTDAEASARSMLVDSTPAERSSEYFFEATARELVHAFHILEEAAAGTRRTIRRVLAHPVYGLGPGSAPDLTLDSRQALAETGGLDKRHLRLL